MRSMITMEFANVRLTPSSHKLVEVSSKDDNRKGRTGVALRVVGARYVDNKFFVINVKSNSNV